MDYKSTRNNNIRLKSSQTIIKGLSDEGGLFVPSHFPHIPIEKIGALSQSDYKGIAVSILSELLSDFSSEEISEIVDKAYSAEKFTDKEIAPVKKLYNNSYVLELFHGPTLAFKDMALQMLPHLLTASVKKNSLNKKVLILVATSGDTGKAALEGFKDVEGVEILVFYPQDGVSRMQKLQMTTQDGNNVRVCAVRGNFDDAQNGVKRIFGDRDIAAEFEAENYILSSANSINLGRLVPQIVYYFFAYCSLLSKGEIKPGEKINFVVPTGNFGNILAAYYAKKMGLPISRLICASNRNNILTEFIKTGEYNPDREFYTTISPSMDILISSNLERLLYDLTDSDDEKISKWLSDLKTNNYYSVDSSLVEKLNEIFFAGYCDDEKTMQTINKVFNSYGYLMDPHTAVAYNVYEQYINETNDNIKTVVVSTASPYKFVEGVYEALTGDKPGDDGFETALKIEKLTSLRIPSAITELKQKKERFTQSCNSDEMKEIAVNIIK